MPTLRLSPTVSVFPVREQLVCRSDLATFELRGVDLPAFAERVIPLLDGSREQAEVLRALPQYSAQSVTRLLDLLVSRGVIEVVSEDPAPSRGADLRRFLRGLSPEGTEHYRRLQASRVLLVGLEAWGASTAMELGAAGVRALGLAEAKTSGASRRDALAALLAERAPGSSVVTFADDAPEEVVFGSVSAPWDLAVVALPSPCPRASIERIARGLHRAHLRSLWCEVSPRGVLLGPLVTPGEAACRVCALSDALNPLPTGGAAPTRADPRRFEAMVSELLALETLRVISRFSDSPLGGRATWFDSTSLESERVTLVRIPWCPVCATA